MLSLAASPLCLMAADETVEQVRQRGASIYSETCAACHGPQGEGVADAYAEPLAGDASVGELAAVIARTMPDGEPEACVADDALAVAEYVHYSFYSEAARIRNRPPRLMLTRLTANQLRQSLADLYASSDGTPDVGDERGVSGVYFDGPRWRKENQKIERVDAKLEFDFGKESPGEGIQAEEFFIHWEGGLKVEQSGVYQIIVRSTCSFVMDFGRMGREFINNHVQSGDKTEFRRTLTLAAGRVYPFKIDFTQRKRKTEQPPARISLAWIPPGGVEETIPHRNLIPQRAPPAFSLQAELPPDDRSYGYERGIGVDRQWDASTTAAALEFGQVAAEELWPSYSKRNRKADDENRQRLRTFLRELVERAFRGPLNDELIQLYINDQVDAAEDDLEAIKRVVLIALKSPRFLYPTLDSDRSASQQAANRLALTLYDSLPADRWLLDQVNRDDLTTEARIRQAANRMATDYRAEGKTLDFLWHWLNLSHVGEITKDQEHYPGFDAELASELKTSLIAFLDEVVRDEASDYRSLFLADWTPTTQRMKEFYGEKFRPASEEGPWPRRSVADPARFGLLTHPYLMSSLAYHDSTSPIHRGVFLIRHMLGRTLRPPAEAFTPLSPDLHPDLTTRERVALQTSPENCQACHQRINGLGFSLENYDAVGRFRDAEREKPINAEGSYTDRLGTSVEFAGPADLAKYLANSEEAQQAFVERAFQHFVKQPIAAFGPDTLTQLTRSFQENDFNMRKLLVEIAVVAATRPQAQPQQES